MKLLIGCEKVNSNQSMDIFQAKELVFSRFDDLLQAKQGVSTIACLLTEVYMYDITIIMQQYDSAS